MSKQKKQKSLFCGTYISVDQICEECAMHSSVTAYSWRCFRQVSRVFLLTHGRVFLLALAQIYCTKSCMYARTINRNLDGDACCTTDKHFDTLGSSAGVHCGTMPKISSSVGTHENSGPCASGTGAGETVRDVTVTHAHARTRAHTHT